MGRTDLYDHVAALIHPPPPEPGPDDDPGQAGYDEALQQAHHDREDLAAMLREVDPDLDPVLDLIARERRDMLGAERRMRLLIAYAREFTRPRPYRLEDLAQAAGMSISGVRTAYDDDEIDTVAALTGTTPRRPTTTTGPTGPSGTATP